MRPKKQVKLADIAERLGTSVVSVSNALSGKKGVSEELRARVVSCARELGYPVKEAPAEAANCIYVVHYENGTSAHLRDALAALGAAASRAGFTLAVRTVQQGFANSSTAKNGFANNDSLEQEFADSSTAKSGFADDDSLEQEFADSGTMQSGAETLFSEMDNAAGIVFAERMTEADMRAVCGAHPGVPAVGYGFFDSHVPIDYICDDGFHGIGIAYRELYRRGHRNICLVTPEVLDADGIDRFLGFQFAAGQHGQSEAEDAAESGLALFLQRLQRMRTDSREDADASGGRPTAAVCTDDETAAAVLLEVKKLGIKVPEDLSVTGYRRSLRSETRKSADITSVVCDEQLLAEKCIGTIRKRITKGNHPEGVRMLIGTLQGRTTTGDCHVGKEA